MGAVYVAYFGAISFTMILKRAADKRYTPSYTTTERVANIPNGPNKYAPLPQVSDGASPSF